MSIAKHFTEALQILESFNTTENFERIEKAGKQMVQAIKNGKRIFSCGNGGSMCDAMHFAEELNGQYRNARKPIPAMSISDPGYLSCVSNDYGYDEVFARYLEGWGNKGDVLLAISTSGNSKNIIKACQVAKKKEMVIIGLSGKDGGELANLADIEIRAPKSEFADRAQEIHIKVIHSLIDYIEQNL